MMTRPTTRLILLFAVAQSLAGCTYIKVTEEDKYFDEPSFYESPPRTLALAPFTNETNLEGAAKHMREKLYGALAPLPYRDLELDKVDGVISSKAQRLGVPPEEVQAEYIVDPELADAVIFAQVENISRIFLFFWAQIRVDVRLLMVETTSRKKIYQNTFTVRNRLITIPLSPGGLINSLISTVWHMREDELADSMRRTAEEIVKRFPAPPGRASAGGTFIQTVDVAVPRSVMRAGDRVLIRVEGSPSRLGQFSIGAKVVEEPLVENTPGEYTGSYLVQEGDVGRFLYVTVSLEDPEIQGMKATFEAIDQPFAIDTIAPAGYEIESWLASPDHPGIVLQFRPSDPAASERDDLPVAFHVYRSDGPNEPLLHIGTSTTPEYEDATAKPETEYEYAVVAEDSAGNLSKPELLLLVTPRVEGSR